MKVIELKQSTEKEIPQFAAMEAAADTAGFVIGWEAERHLEEMQKNEVIYLSILHANELAGFFILATEPDGETVEFRRIVVSKKGRGIGQMAIAAMEEYSRMVLNRKTIWLDVIETNLRGIHIYEKLGYRRFNVGEQSGKSLIFYRKSLNGLPQDN